MLSYEKVFQNNRKWLKEKKDADSDFFRKFSHGQNPDFMIIGCSDSRVPLETIMGAEPGDLFVHRNIANVVSTSDTNILSVIEYAVKHLKVKHIVVCGHTKCGGVKTAMESKDEDTILGSWVSNIREVMHNNSKDLDNLDKDEKYKRLIELNTQEQCRNIDSLKLVRSSRLESGHPLVHAWLYDIETGLLKDLGY